MSKASEVQGNYLVSVRREYVRLLEINGVVWIYFSIFSFPTLTVENVIT